MLYDPLTKKYYPDFTRHTFIFGTKPYPENIVTRRYTHVETQKKKREAWAEAIKGNKELISVTTLSESHKEHVYHEAKKGNGGINRRIELEEIEEVAKSPAVKKQLDN